jgi:hypothetical protein
MTIDQFEGRQAQVEGAALSFSDGAGLSITGSMALPGTSTFLQLSNVTDRRAFVNYDLTSARHVVAPSNATFEASNLRVMQRTEASHAGSPAAKPTSAR